MFLNLYALQYWRFYYVRIGLFFFFDQGELFSCALLQKCLGIMEESNFTALGDDIFGCLNMLGQFGLEQDSKGPKYLGAVFMNLSHSLFTAWHLTHLKRKTYQVSLKLWTWKSPTFWQTPLPRELTYSGKGSDDNFELHMISTPKYQLCGKGNLETCNDDCFMPWSFVPTFPPPLTPVSQPVPTLSAW